ncbi:MAG: cation diffusion facilitator family transporter [Gammaproteobacteria bacterium]|nr:cation diffusion facilitator family transporter [Gammaproteobacteria bacterium]
MTKLLQHKSIVEKNRKVRSILIIEGFANLIILTIKAWVGIYTGSSAILSDALHSLSDLFNNILAFTLIKISSYGPDLNHPYGHRKFETLAVFILATLLSVVAIEIVFRAFERIGNPILLSQWGFILMCGVLVINIGISSWEHYWAVRLDSEILKADARHTLSDILTTVAVIGGWQLAARGYPMFDFLLSLGISIFVLYLAYTLFSKCIPILVDSTSLDHEQVISYIEQLHGVVKVRRMRSRVIEHGIFADIIVIVGRHLSTNESHAIADQIEHKLAELYGMEDVVIHIEPEEP